MKILFTGMSSSHCKETKNVSFFSTLALAYGEVATVTWDSPKTWWTRSNLEEFDLIVFGFSPPTSPAANKLYGALHVLNLMYESPKLRLVVDSPQIWQYKNSIRSFKRDPDQVFSSFFSNRVDYSVSKSGPVRSAIASVAEKMGSLPWPKTFVPAVPWLSTADLAAKASFISPKAIIPISIDSFLLQDPTSSPLRSNTWAVENLNSSWWKTVNLTTRYSGIATVSGSKDKDAQAMEVIKSSLALVVPPQDRKMGTWWSYRVLQALNSGTPVVTYWQDTSDFDSSWAYLAYQIEDADPFERQKIASDQLAAYRKSIPSKEETLNTLKSIVIDLSKERI